LGLCIHGVSPEGKLKYGTTSPDLPYSGVRLPLPTFPLIPLLCCSGIAAANNATQSSIKLFNQPRQTPARLRQVVARQKTLPFLFLLIGKSLCEGIRRCGRQRSPATLESGANGLGEQCLVDVELRCQKTKVVKILYTRVGRAESTGYNKSAVNSSPVNYLHAEYA
jgi:hypothetical protein